MSLSAAMFGIALAISPIASGTHTTATPSYTQEVIAPAGAHQAAKPGVMDVRYMWQGRSWRYRWRGGYYNWRWNGRYWRSRYRCVRSGRRVWCYR